MSALRWGILSTGRIARRFAQALQASETGTLTAVASREFPKAESFAKEFGAQKAYGRYQDLLDDPEVQAIYLATPHPQHAEWAIRAARAKKHILCEKPAAMSWAETSEMIDTARENGVFFMEAFMYRCHPQTARLVEVLQSGRIGQVHLIQATFSFHAPYSRESRLFNKALGGGAILDVGCYCASMCRLIAGAAQGWNRVAEPTEVKGAGWIDPTEGTDLLASAILKFPGNLIAQLSAGTQLQQENVVRVVGSKGHLVLSHPWFAGCDGATLTITQKDAKEPEILSTTSPRDLYAYEIDLVAAQCHAGQAMFPAPTWDDTLGNMRVLDAWRREVGAAAEDEGSTVVCG
jgi:predicted dehydrogenase